MVPCRDEPTSMHRDAKPRNQHWVRQVIQEMSEVCQTGNQGKETGQRPEPLSHQAVALRIQVISWPYLVTSQAILIDLPPMLASTKPVLELPSLIARETSWIDAFGQPGLDFHSFKITCLVSAANSSGSDWSVKAKSKTQTAKYPKKQEIAISMGGPQGFLT